MIKKIRGSGYSMTKESLQSRAVIDSFEGKCYVQIRDFGKCYEDSISHKRYVAVRSVVWWVWYVGTYDNGVTTGCGTVLLVLCVQFSPDHMANESMGVGCVIQDDQGCFVRAFSKVIHGRMQHRETEAIALHEVLSWTKDWRCDKCVFECDSKQVVDAIRAREGMSYFHTIIEECKDILKHFCEFCEVLVVFGPRSANTAAHLIAQVTYSMSGF
ncbi:hypothetical protein AgCh_029259 [Apium graveolens]